MSGKDTIHKVANEANFEDEASRLTALRKMKNFSDVQLQSVVMIPRENLAGAWKKAAVLAEVEISRRNDEQARKLARNTTYISGLIGLVGVILGVILAEYLDGQAVAMVDQSSVSRASD